MVAGFILELPDGSRDFISIDADFTGLTLKASGWIIRGLETMLTHGNVIEVTVKSCAVGYITNLDAVREVPPPDMRSGRAPQLGSRVGWAALHADGGPLRMPRRSIKASAPVSNS